MFDIGFSELFVIAIVALLVLGPERLPKAARFVGLWVRRARAQWYSVKSELENELADDELKRSLMQARDQLHGEMRHVRDGLHHGAQTVREGFEASAGRSSSGPLESVSPVMPGAVGTDTDPAAAPPRGNPADNPPATGPAARSDDDDLHDRR